ncbi:MAG: glycosyltransferase family 9 protein [bacterium]
MKILIVRNDGIGDIILTLPAISGIRRLYPDASISILVSPYTKDILWNNKDIDEIIVDDKGIFETSKMLFKTKFDIAFIFYPNLRNAFISFLAGIPERIGTGYKPCGILFNKRRYIHRRDIHESNWCLKLVNSQQTVVHSPKIFVKDEDLKYAKSLISEIPEPIIGIHPGCKGSALNWTSERYTKLIEKIEERYKTRPIITGGMNDKQVIDRIIRETKANPLNLYGKTNLGELIALISLFSIFIGPSTGPLHIASCLGVKTIGLFPLISSQSPKKWHPLGENYYLLTPDIICKEKRCKGLKCKEYNCMERIKEEDILEKIEECI